MDDFVSHHGETLLEFLRDSKMYIINGRIFPLSDNFYIPIWQRKSCGGLYSNPPQLSNCYRCFDLFGEESRLPDNSLLFWIFSVGHKLSQPGISVHHSGQKIHTPNRPKCNKIYVINDFLCSEMACKSTAGTHQNSAKMPRNTISFRCVV